MSYQNQNEIARLSEKAAEARSLRLEMQDFFAGLQQETTVQQTNRENYARWQQQLLQRAIVIVTVIVVTATIIAGVIL